MSYDNLIGKTLEEAKKIHPHIRIISENGIGRMVTADFKLNRINVSLESGKIVKATVG